MREYTTLTDRQRQVLQLAAEGLKNYQIADALGLSRSTIAPIFDDIYHKMGIRQARQQAIWLYLQGGRYA